MDIVHVSTKGQIVIPEKVRERLGIQAGTKLVLIEKESTLVLIKEENVEKQMDVDERKETIGWMILAEHALKKVWDNPKDEETWKKYL